MKIALICNGSEQLGIQYISASLKKSNHQTRLFLDPCLFNDKIVFNFVSLEKMFSMRKKLIDAVVDWEPDLIGISSVTVTYQWSKDIARALKEKLPNKLIIIGGPHAILTPEVIIQEPCFDIVCIGEGEKAVVELADSIRNNAIDYSIKDLWFRKDGEIIINPLRNLQEDLDELPLPDRSIFEPYYNMSDSLLTMSLRGCMFRCAYCSHNVIREKYKGKGKYVRRKSPEKFISELEYFKNKYKYKFVRIYDDIFTHDLEWLEKFSLLYKKKINLPFFCLGHPMYLDEDRIRLINEAGCKWIQVGIESLNEQTRKKILNRPESNNQIYNSISLLEKYKMRYELDFIFGLPGDDENTYKETVDFLKPLNSLNRVSALILSFLPKTEIINHSLKYKDIDVDEIKNIEEGLESSQTDKGSIRKEHTRKLSERYNLLYRLCAFMGEGKIDFPRKTGLIKVLVYLNPFLLYIIRIMGMDIVDKIFVKLFFRQSAKIAFFKNKYYNFDGGKE